MCLQRRGCSRRSQFLASIALLVVLRPSPSAEKDQQRAKPLLPTNDPIVARVYEHNVNAPRPLVLVVDNSNFPPSVWNRVNNLVAFRMHRPQPDGGTLVDAPIYIVRNSALYLKADAALRNGTTNDEYVWCLLAAVLAHEGAHKAPMTEREALIAEAEQLRRCLFAGLLHTGSGWSATRAYLLQVEAKLRQSREHY
jgi:hypothetical protein